MDQVLFWKRSYDLRIVQTEPRKLTKTVYRNAVRDTQCVWTAQTTIPLNFVGCETLKFMVEKVIQTILHVKWKQNSWWG